jgi:hypothetical protein
MNAKDRRKKSPVISDDEFLRRVNADIASWHRRSKSILRACEPTRLFGATLEDLAGLLVLHLQLDLVQSYAQRNVRITNDDLDFYNRGACIIAAATQPLLFIASGVAGARASEEQFATRVYD